VIRIVEVGPRDGLQNESITVPTDLKLNFIRRLIQAGIREIEATSFVSPKWVPQLGDAAELWPVLPSGGLFSALVPNMKGLERALEVGVDRIALFTATSDEFTRKNINMSVEESLAVFADVASEFRKARPDGWIRGYVSTAFECPYAGPIEPSQTVRIAERLVDLGVNEVSIGDTIGVAAPKEVKELTPMLLSAIGRDRLAYHFHDTRGTAIANVEAALGCGVWQFDSAAAGLGGCPYARGAGGNLATEDLVYLLEREGIDTGVDINLLAQASQSVLQHLGRRPTAKVQRTVLAE